VQQLLDELASSDASPEEVCSSCPELLSQVRARWLQMCRMQAELDAVFLPAESTDKGSSAGGPENGPLPVIPGYEVQTILGRGGMGVVFRARHFRLNRVVALKMTLAGAYAGPHERSRFQREAEAVARLQHPNVVQIHDVGESDGRPYFTMEYVAGGSLTEKLSGAPQPAREAAALVAALAGAVQVAHKSEIVHRDLKPGNILLTADGTPKISDFGLARRLDGASALTWAGAAFGTPSYMAPEQAAGRPEAVGPAADIYSLGAILYEMLTGRPPFRAESAAATVEQVLTRDPVPPSRLNPTVPRDLETICLKCLQKAPADRYASAQALADDLRRFGEGRPILARPVGWPMRLWRWIRRNPTAAGLLAALLVLVLLTIGGALWLQRQQAERQGRAQEAIEAALIQAPGLRQQGRWPEAKAVLTQASSRLDDAGSEDLRRRLQQAAADLELAATLEQIRLTPAIEGYRFDYRGMAAAYADAFKQAGLDVHGDEETVAARIRDSDLRPQVVMALDHWAYVADALADRRLMARLLLLARRADPDPDWRDRFRDPALWGNPKALQGLAAETEQQLMRGVPEKDPPTPLLSLLAEKLGQKGGQAEPLLRAAQRRHPEDFWLNYTLGETMRDRKPAEAVGFCRAALATRPMAAEVHLQLGTALLRQGLVDEAILACRKATQLSPTFAAAYNNLGMCLHAKNQLDAAMAEFRHAMQLAPTNGSAHFNLGMCWQAKDRLDEAMAEYRRAIELDPEGAPAHFQLGVCWQLRGQLDDAMAAYRRAIELDPKGSPAHYQLGTSLQARGRHDEAVAEYRRASQLDPERGPGHEGLANALLHIGRFAEARVAIMNGLGELPAKEPRRPALEELLKLCDRLLAVEARLPALVRGEEHSAAAELLELARLCRDFGRPHAAARLYVLAFAARPALADDPGAFYRYAAACAAAGAAAGEGYDGARLSGPERAGLRRQALDWLRADMALRTRQFQTGKSIDWAVAFWQPDPDLGSVRDPAALAKLPAEERASWQRLWADVAALRAADPVAQGRMHAARREWAAATTDYVRALKRGPTDDGEMWFEYAALLLLSGDRPGYVRACAHMIEACGKPGGPRPYHVARACTLAPDAVREASLPGRLAEKELQSAAGASWSLTEKGALHYRAGRFLEAVALFEQSLRADRAPGKAVLNWLWLALAQQRLGKAEEARRWLDRATAWLDQYRDGMPERAEAGLGLHLHNWLEAHVMRREAESLIRSMPAISKHSQ
jgi:serine/threonine-protein kinase